MPVETRVHPAVKRIAVGLRARGWSMRAIGERLAESGLPTPGGGEWGEPSVRRLFDRLDGLTHSGE